MIAHGLVNSFKIDLIRALARDVFRIALYNANAHLTKETLSYTTKDEVIGSPGYTPGGKELLGVSVTQDGDAAILNWANPVWPNSTIMARAALIYNYSRGNAAVGVLDFGKNVTSTNGDFKINLPTALVRFA